MSWWIRGARDIRSRTNRIKHQGHGIRSIGSSRLRGIRDGANLNTGAERNTETDATGNYQVLPTGGRLRGDRPSKRRRGRGPDGHKVGQEAVADLRPHPAGVQERVVVNADASGVGVKTADISGLVREQELRDLALNGRSYDERQQLSSFDLGAMLRD